MGDQPVEHRWIDGSKIGLAALVFLICAEVVASVQLLQRSPDSELAKSTAFGVLGATFLSGALLFSSCRMVVEGQSVHWHRRSVVDWLRGRAGIMRQIQPGDLRSFRLSKYWGLEQTLRLSLSDGSTISVTRSGQQPYARTFDAFLADLRAIAGHREQG